MRALDVGAVKAGAVLSDVSLAVVADVGGLAFHHQHVGSTVGRGHQAAALGDDRALGGDVPKGVLAELIVDLLVL